MATAFKRVDWAPDHVPVELCWDHDINTFAGELDDPFVAVSRMHDGPPIVWARATSHGQPAWVPTRYALIQEIFLDAKRFSSDQNIGVGRMMGVDWQLNPLEIDPPEHMAYRQVLQPWFQPSAINRLEPAIRRVASDLLSEFENKGGCEFIEDFAAQFPSRVFLELMGLPTSMLEQFFVWEHAFIRSTDPMERVNAAVSIKDYLAGYLEERRSDPRDDIVTGILTAEIKGRPLNHGEMMGMAMVLYFGGLDTVLSSIGWYMAHIAKDQVLQQRLRDDPASIPAVIEEMLRAYGVVGTHRTVTEDLEFHGIHMKKGDRVLMPGYLASRDPAQYDDPHRIDPDRKARHLTLATGPHNCLGAHLARREIKVVLEEFLARFANIRIPAGEAVAWQTQGIWAVTQLPLTWD